MLPAQNFDSLCTQQKLVLRNIAAFHYSPPEFNTNTCLQVLGLFVKGIDERNILITSGDREKFASMVKEKNADEAACLLTRSAFTVLQKRVWQVDSILNSIEAKPLVFSARDTIVFFGSRQERHLSGNLSEMARRLEKLIKYEALVDMVTPKKDSFDVFGLSPAELGKLTETSKKKAVKRLKQFLSEYKNANRLSHHVADCLSNAFAQRCDPHSDYFNTFEMENFKSALSTTDFSFGFGVSEDENGNVVISELIPGGPAWKSNTLNEKDVILSFTFEGESEVELDNWELDSFYDLFYKSSSKTVTLKIRKKDFKIVTVTLAKEKIQSQENVLNSYLVKFGGLKMGYIPIPSFYLDDEEDSRQGCANDVAKEIIELKQDSIKGLILDLRYNGGGSMREAMGLSGIFIDEGPVAVYRPKTGKPFLLKDLNRGSIWDGPLVILVNSASASASEFVTATLQDYNRAIVVGSRTFGKGTAQNVLLADSTSSQQNNAAYGYLKLTNGKFYRLTTESHQGKGIQPDIAIPGIIEKVMETESDYPYFLPCDTVTKKVVFNRLSPLPKEAMRAKSDARVNAQPNFTQVKRLGDSLITAKKKDEPVALTVKDFKKYYDKQQAFDNMVDYIFIDHDKRIEISNNTQNEKLSAISEFQRKSTDNAIAVLKNDLILHESIYILNDLVTILNK